MRKQNQESYPSEISTEETGEPPVLKRLSRRREPDLPNNTGEEKGEVAKDSAALSPEQNSDRPEQLSSQTTDFNDEHEGPRAQKSTAVKNVLASGDIVLTQASKNREHQSAEARRIARQHYLNKWRRRNQENFTDLVLRQQSERNNNGLPDL